ncbi:MAG: bifunctional nuclease family protein [Flavobacteriales bacterium]|nr:bifunctional nuclease family protein [Flavobacteriales bacterium]NUM51734.1 bifunctional nuclease family protein [Flavobacteriales bacterium]
MDKIQLEIVGLSYSQTQSGAYALVLGEVDGRRRLPIIIGGFEAQAIAIELENMKPSRPLTHDLFKSMADMFEVTVKEVVIYNLVEGIFYSKLICEKNGKEEELDTRTSDAIALAVRFKCPIYTYEFILAQSGIILEGEGKILSESNVPEKPKKTKKKGKSDYSTLSDEELNIQLQHAIENENYEEASVIKKELDGRKKS